MPEYLIALLAALPLFAVTMPLYLHMKRGPHRKLALLLKGLSTLIPAALCFIGASSASAPPGSCWMATGLALCLVGDVVLELHFIAGMGAFLLGHLCYIGGFLSQKGPSLWIVGYFIPLMTLVTLLFLPLLPKLEKPRTPYIVYVVVIVGMLSAALPLPFALGARGVLQAAGASLFVLSDLLLARNMLTFTNRVRDTVSLSCYYAGQYLLAISVWCFAWPG